MSPVVAFALVASLSVGPVAADEPDATSQAVVNLLVKQLKDRDPKKRVDAAKELGGMGSKAKEASRPLCEACMDASGKVSVAAIDAVEKIRPDLHKHIVTIVSDPNTSKQEQAFEALAKLKDEANPVTPILLIYVSRGAVAKRTGLGPCTVCMKCIAAIASDDPTILPSLTGISRQYPGTQLTNECLAVLSRLGEAKPELRKKVYPTLVASLSTSCRLQAIRGLARFGPDARDALPLLKKLRFDKEEDVRNASTDAIEKIEKADARP